MKLYPNLKLDTGDSPLGENLGRRSHFSENNDHHSLLLPPKNYHTNTHNNFRHINLSNCIQPLNTSNQNSDNFSLTNRPIDHPKGPYSQQRIITQFSKKICSKKQEDPSKGNIRFSNLEKNC